MLTSGELKRAADDALFANAPEQALRLYLQLLELQPLHLDARLRIADALLALGDVQRAAVVYTRLAQYAAHAGYPLRALTALKMLGAIEPELAGLVRSVSELYARDSARLGRGVRRSLLGEAEPLPRGSVAPQDPLGDLVAQAERIASDYDHPDALFPDKLMPIPLLSSLDHEDLGRVFDACGLLRVRPGALLLEQGSRHRSLYMLARGSARVQRRHDDGRVQPMITLGEGAIFGELSFLSGAPRTAEVVALSDCDLLELPWSALEPAGEALAKLRQLVSDFARERMLSYVMSNAPLFAPLETQQRLDLVKRFVELEVPAGAEIVRQGEPSAGAYVVLRGEVLVRRSEGERSVELARLASGELFGEMSLLSGEGATATVQAIDATTVLLLGKQYFDRLLEAVPDLRVQLEQLADRRSRQIAASFPPRPGEPEFVEVEVLL
jgi:cAMP-dependent protein kinase regulator